MSSQLLNKPGALVDFGVADEVIAGLKGRLTGLTADTPAGYESVRAGIAEVRTIRTGVEKSRKELKQSALEWGRKVDAEAKRVTSLLLEIEEPLKEEKARIDDEKDRIKREAAEAAERERLAKEKAEREAREKAEAIERDRIRKEQEAEQARLAEERKKLEAERAEQDRIRREREAELEAAREEIRKEREKIEAEKREREAEERRKIEAAERAKREAEEAERREEERKQAALRAEAERKERERIAEERKPDVEKLREWLGKIDGMSPPSLKTEWGQRFSLETFNKVLDVVAVASDELKGLTQ